MVKKLPIRERMKPVINALREGKKTWSDLKQLGIPPEKAIPERTLDRILKDYLEYWGLATKEGDYWVWYEHSRVFKSRHDYELAIEHSRKLLPAFQNMLEVVATDRHPLYFAAKEHLRSYPEIYHKLEKFEEAFNERVRGLLQKYGHKIKTSDRFWVMHWEKRKGKGFFGKIFGEWGLVKDEVPYMIEWGSTKPSEAEMKEINELRDFLDDTEAFNERFEIYHELAGDIYVLMLKVEMGSPLEGSCSLCPKITIKQKT